MKTNVKIAPMLLLLGACPAMAASVSLTAALAMGLAVTVTLVLNTLVMSLLKKTVTDGSRMAVSVLVSGGVVSLLQLLMNALLPGIHQTLGVYLALVAVNLLALSGGEKPLGKGCLEGFQTGLKFLAVVLVTALIREVFGNATLAGMELSFLADYRIPTLTQVNGGFFTYAIVAAAVNAIWGGMDAEAADFAAWKED